MKTNKDSVLEYLQSKGEFVSPTEIGRIVGGNGRHSAWGSPLCKILVAEGKAKRNNKGWYKAL
jgi:hypothetical protein